MSANTNVRTEAETLPYGWRQLRLTQSENLIAYTSDHHRVRVQILSQDDLLSIAGTLHHLLDTELWAEEWEIDVSELPSPSLGLVSIVYGFDQLCRKQHKRLTVTGPIHPYATC